jgi:preprotein translocase subunit SecY
VQNSFFQLFKIPETRNKIWATLLLLLAYRVGFHIPIPGMNPAFLKQHQDQGSLFGLMSAFSGGDIGNTNLFALGIMPYISASIIFSMLGKVSPAIEAIQKEGAAGQKKINQWTRLAVVPIALIQALFIYTGVFLKDPSLLAENMRGNHLVLGLVVVLSLMAGALLVMWIGELITEFGVGNGLVADHHGRHRRAIPQRAATVDETEFWQTLAPARAIWAVTCWSSCSSTRARDACRSSTRGSRAAAGQGGQRHYLPLKVNMAGVMPIVFASVIFIIPALIFDWLGWRAEGRLQHADRLRARHVLCRARVLLLLLLEPPDVPADGDRRQPARARLVHPGIRPGQKTAEFLSSVLTRITLAGAAFLALIAIAPSFVTQGTAMPQDMRYFLGGTSVLIVVGVALDLVDRLNAQLVMRNYDGFMKSSGPGWTRGGRGDSK